MSMKSGKTPPPSNATRHSARISAKSAPAAVPDSSPTLGENSFDPEKHTPHVNRLMHNKRDLTDYEKQVVDRFVALYGPSDRALITLEKAFNFCHLVEQSTTEAQIEAPTEHHQLDHHQLAHIPARKHLEKIFHFYTNRDPKTKPKPFEELFPRSKDGWSYELLPLTMDKDKHIFRQILRNNPDRSYSSTGKYEEHVWPYQTLVMQSHAKPLCAIWHAAEQLFKLDTKELKKITLMLPPSLQASITDILTLRRIWVVPKDVGGKAGEKTAIEALEPVESVSPLADDDSDPEHLDDDLGDMFSAALPDLTPKLDESDPEVSDLVSSFTVSLFGAASEPGSCPTWSAPARHDTRPPSTRFLDDNPPDTISDSSRKRKPSRSPSASPGQPILGDSLDRPATQSRREPGIPIPVPSARPFKAPRTLSESAARTIKDGSGPVANAPDQRPKFTWGPYDKTLLPSTSRGELGSAGSARSSGKKLQAQLPPEIPVHQNLTDGGIIITPASQAFHDTVTGKISRASGSYPNSTSSIPRSTGRRPDDDRSSGSRRARPSNSGTGNPCHRPIAGRSVTENNSVTSTSGSRGSSNSDRARRTLPGKFGSTTPKPESPDEPKT
ncbi:hypothetical protein C8J56DRAFT_1075324 [Mycena floridula]|nr:hypothetical protein C8J56DRAFT_1075324 [Mycena floridula]